MINVHDNGDATSTRPGPRAGRLGSGDAPTTPSSFTRAHHLSSCRGSAQSILCTLPPGPTSQLRGQAQGEVTAQGPTSSGMAQGDLRFACLTPEPVFLILGLTAFLVGLGEERGRELPKVTKQIRAELGLDLQASYLTDHTATLPPSTSKAFLTFGNICSFIPSFLHSCTHSFIHPSIHPSTHPVIQQNRE